MRRLSVLIIALSLTACSDDTRTAGGVTKGEADALDDAAAMVEEQRPPADAATAPQPPVEPDKK
ncbi:MAG: hypothetical protein KA329_10065 [Novosphingobium sp.]|nr:hypothetical protein [Novosphingobium sp.]